MLRMSPSSWEFPSGEGGSRSPLKTPAQYLKEGHFVILLSTYGKHRNFTDCSMY